MVAGAAAAIVGLAAGPALADMQPDGRIRVKGTGSYVGNNIISNEGSGQTARKKVLPGRSARFEVKVRNAGTAEDDIRLQAVETPSCADFTFKVFLGGVDRTFDNNSGDLIYQSVGDRRFVGTVPRQGQGAE